MGGHHVAVICINPWGTRSYLHPLWRGVKEDPPKSGPSTCKRAKAGELAEWSGPKGPTE